MARRAINICELALFATLIGVSMQSHRCERMAAVKTKVCVEIAYS